MISKFSQVINEEVFYINTLTINCNETNLITVHYFVSLFVVIILIVFYSI